MCCVWSWCSETFLILALTRFVHVHVHKIWYWNPFIIFFITKFPIQSLNNYYIFQISCEDHICHETEYCIIILVCYWYFSMNYFSLNSKSAIWLGVLIFFWLIWSYQWNFYIWDVSDTSAHWITVTNVVMCCDVVWCNYKLSNILTPLRKLYF